MSIEGGLHRAIERAAAVRATALQLFVKSARQWSARALAPAEIQAFARGLDAGGLSSATLAHGSYLINLASPDDTVWHRSIDALALELARCAELGIPQLVIHPGCHMGAGEASGLRRIVRALDRLFTGQGQGVHLLLEITAGQGSSLGHRFEQLRWILERARTPERLGVCFDTCHALAAGYDLRSARAYHATFDELERILGLSWLRAFHLNDSRHGLGSRRDRHEHIGHGQLGLTAFRLLLQDPRWRDRPMLIETPKGKDLAADRRNLATLRRLAS
jgi:deoxyribonuclease-4